MAIEDCVTSMKSCIQEELDNYYDIATVDARIKLLQEAIDNGDAAADEKLESEIEAVNESIATALHIWSRTAERPKSRWAC